MISDKRRQSLGESKEVTEREGVSYRFCVFSSDLNKNAGNETAFHIHVTVGDVGYGDKTIDRNLSLDRSPALPSDGTKCP